MPTLPTTTVAFSSSATEVEFKTFLNEFRDYVSYMLGATGLPADSIVGGIPAGSKVLFAQAAAPTGWTKDTTHNDKSIRVVSGTGGGSGGVQAFSTVFGRTASDASSLSIAQLAAHTHSLPMTTNNTAGTTKSSADRITTSAGFNSGSEGSGSAHAHGLDLRVQYVDVIICTKN